MDLISFGIQLISIAYVTHHSDIHSRVRNKTILGINIPFIFFQKRSAREDARIRFEHNQDNLI
jgi:hypothetical protein